MAGVTLADLAIVGAGPTGLFAAYSAGFRGLDTTVIDVLDRPGGQIAALYPNKVIYDVPAHPAITGAQLVDALLAQVAPFGPTMLLGRQAQRIESSVIEGRRRLVLSDGSAVEARAVLITAGVGGIVPRPLPVGGEWLGRGVAYTVEAPTTYDGRRVVVVGGGDSALDWALELAPYAAHVTVLHRRKIFRAHGTSVERALASGVELLTETQIVGTRGGSSLAQLVVRDGAGMERDLEVDAVIGALGLLSDLGPLTDWGLELHDRRVRVDGAMMTNLAGVFAAGDLAWYPGKVALISTGFGEAATAVSNAAIFLDPEAQLAPGHSTDRPGPLALQKEDA